MATTGLIPRRDIKSALIAGQPSTGLGLDWIGPIVEGEVVFATDTKEFGFLNSTNDIKWVSVDDIGVIQDVDENTTDEDTTEEIINAFSSIHTFDVNSTIDNNWSPVVFLEPLEDLEHKNFMIDVTFTVDANHYPRKIIWFFSTDNIVENVDTVLTLNTTTCIAGSCSEFTSQVVIKADNTLEVRLFASSSYSTDSYGNSIYTNYSGNIVVTPVR